MAQLKPQTRRVVGALLLGAATVGAFAPLSWFPLAWLTLGGFFAFLCAAEKPREGAWLGAAFGFGLFVAGVSWVYVSLSVFGGMMAPLAGLATLVFCAGLSIYPALVGTLFVRFSPAADWRRGAFFAALWTLGEWLRAWLLTGFPWLTLGYAQSPPSPLAGFAPVFGVFGVSLLTVLIATLLATAAQRVLTRGIKDVARPLAAALLVLVAGALLRPLQWTSTVGDPLSVSLLQGNVAQDIKWRAEGFDLALHSYYQLARDNPAQLVVLPEAAFPVFRQQLPQDYLDELQKVSSASGGNLLFGIVTGDLARYANSAVNLGPSGEQHYSKSHLVPFGEFVPPGFSWFLALADIPMSGFTAGAIDQPPLDVAGQKIAANICYEDAFGEAIIRALPQATLLVNLSNVAWFGDSLAPPQHLQIAQMRALETGRMMLRATNTGMTAIIGADGTLHGVLKPYTRAALRGEVRGYSGATPFVRWGNAPVIVCALLLVVFLARRRARLS